MRPDKELILKLIVEKLQHDLHICSQAVEIARDTATHKDCLGSSKYETMGTEASYLAFGQGTRLLELERALAWFKQLKLSLHSEVAGLSSLIQLEDEDGNLQYLWLAADAGGLQVEYHNYSITVITNQSPLGRALLGKSTGDDISLTIAGKLRNYTVLAVY